MKQQETALVSKLLSGDVKKPTALVHFQRNLSPLEQKIMTLIVFHCQTAKEDKHGFYYIRKKFVREFLGWKDSWNYPLIYEAFRNISNNDIQWNFLDADRTFDSLECKLIISILTPSTTGNCIGFKLHPDLEPIIKDPKVFAKLKLIMMAILAKPKYSYALYELLADCYCRGQEDVQISLPKLKKYLGISNKSYLNASFKDFKVRVLKPNIEAINKHTDYFVTYKTYRVGRQIGGLIFHIKKQTWQPPLFVEAMQELQRYFENAALASPVRVSTESLPEEQDFITSVAVYRISETDARKSIERHGLNGAMEIRDYVLRETERRKATDNPVRKISSYMARCLLEGHGKKTAQEHQEAEKKHREESARERKTELKQRIDRIKKTVDHARKERFHSAKSSLSPEEKEQFRTKFVATVDSGQHGESVKSSFQSLGWKAPGINPMFDVFLRNNLLPPEIDDLRSIAKASGDDYDTLVEEVENVTLAV